MIDYFETKTQPITRKQVWEAYREVKGNGQSAGVDKVSLEAFGQDLSRNLYKVWNRMSSGSYFPPPVREKEIPKKDGSKRKLGIPTVGDRVAQMVVKRYLEPQTEPYFHNDSYGYRPGKSALEAVSETRKRCWKYAWVLDIDIKGFFDNIDHDLLMLAVQKHCTEKWVLMYIERWLKAPLEKQDGSQVQRMSGTPQGGVISPLLANLFLHYAFDKWMDKNYPGMCFERYADDIIVHCETKGKAEVLLRRIRERFERCKLELHPVKTKIVYCKQANRKGNHEHVSFTFLGYQFKPRKVKTRQGKYTQSFTAAISRTASAKILADIRQLNIQNRTGAQAEELAQLLNPKIRGWINYYGRFSRSSLHTLMYRVNNRLVKWVMNRYKRIGTSIRKAIKWLKRLYMRFPNLYVHWSYGFKPV